jgi:peroxiredoxin
MANALTGDYEAVLQIAIRQINGVLGTLHQNGATQDAALQTPHSTTGRIGDPGRRPPDVSAFGDWLIEFQQAGPGRGLRDIRTQLTATAPPGAAQMLSDAFAKFDRDWVVVFPPEAVVRGMAKLQVSTVTITVPQGSSSEITVHVGIRAQYYPDSGTADLPAPIHGDVHAAFEVRKVPVFPFPFGSRTKLLPTRLVISPSSQDSKIQFTAAPGSGLSAFDENALAVQVRKVLRDMTLLPVDLPRNFPFDVFKGLGSAIALPFQLSPGASAPASGVQPLTQSFIGSSGFAVAVNKDYVSGLINLDAIRQAVNNFSQTITVSGPFGIGSVSVTFRLRFTSGPTLTFKTGGVEVSGQVAVDTNVPLINGSLSFKQLVTLVLDTSSQTVSLVLAGNPNVDEPWFLPHDTAVGIVRSQIDNALDRPINEEPNAPSVRQAVGEVFTDASGALGNGLDTFDPSALVSYTGVEITPDGVIVRGEISSIARRAPVVQIAETNQSSAFTAFESWMPAGRIDRLIWSWVEYSHFNVWEGVERSFTDEHRFIFPKPAAATQLGQICLRIEGTQTFLSGQEVSVAAGTTCHLPEPVFEMDVPSWWEPVTLPVWRPGLTDTTVLRNAIAAHVGVQVNVPGKAPLSQNTLVYFADWQSEKPLDVLGAALGHVRNTAALMVIVVLPAGAFDASRRELESRLASSRERLRVPVQFTEDDEGGWARTFAVTKRPSVYLINAKREFVWKHEGEPDPAELAAAVDKYLVPTSTPRFRPLRLAISQGDPAPDALFETDDRDQLALHRFLGQEILLNFWQSWSAPCLTELARLQRLQEARREPPFIVAFHGGKDSNAFAEIRRRLGLSFALVQDSEQRIARRYGVRCWPTTITVDADGRAEHIQFGIGHEQIRTPEQLEPAVRSA